MRLYEEIKAFLPRIDGWCTEKKAMTLASIVIAMRPKVVVEIGVFGGKSALPMAMALREIGSGTIHCIDAWDKSVAADGENEANADWWGKLDHEAIYSKFVSWTRVMDVERFCSIHKKKSDDVVPPEDIGLFHCDGSHTDQAVLDVIRFAKNVKKGGIVVMDDIEWSGGGVKKACEALLQMGFIQLYIVQGASENWGVFQKL